MAPPLGHVIRSMFGTHSFGGAVDRYNGYSMIQPYGLDIIMEFVNLHKMGMDITSETFTMTAVRYLHLVHSKFTQTAEEGQ